MLLFIPAMRRRPPGVRSMSARRPHQNSGAIRSDGLGVTTCRGRARTLSPATTVGGVRVLLAVTLIGVFVGLPVLVHLTAATAVTFMAVAAWVACSSPRRGPLSRSRRRSETSVW